MTNRLQKAKRAYVLHRSRRTIVKVHGLPRSGTNYLTKLIKLNFPDVICASGSELGWKHGPIAGPSRRGFVVIVRHPLAWLEAFHHWEVAHGRSTAETVGEFLVTDVSHPELVQTWETADPLAIWNSASTSWLESPNQPEFVRYEDLLRDLSGTLDSALKSFGLEKPSTGYVDLAERADSWSTTIVRRRLDPTRDLQQSYLDAYSRDQLETIRTGLSVNNLARLGYEIA